AIPAVEAIDTHEAKPTVQVLVLCPTRELAQQACDEIGKLTKFKTGIVTADVYGGAPMGPQILRLKRANIVIGTPGRIMDHMRRKTLKLSNIKMVVLDEADEMLNMGFKEDIETILVDTPENRQTILFSATMPPAILALTKQFQNDPQLIEIDKAKVTLTNIEQSYVNVPMGRKMDALNLLLRYHRPNRALVFCNTKHMVDEITEYLGKHGFDAEGLHGDMKQAQRTKTLGEFKSGKLSILVATDVAARGIDVNNVDYVFNYDIPQSTEYYVHRIGRTGRAGKNGCAITICSGNKQGYLMKDISRVVKSDIKLTPMPSSVDIKAKQTEANLAEVETAIAGEALPVCAEMLSQLLEKGHSAEAIATALLQLHFGSRQPTELADIRPEPAAFSGNRGGGYQKIQLDVGRDNRVAPNHIVGAITERTCLSGRDIGKIEIYDTKTIVSIPAASAAQVMQEMDGCKISGRPTKTILLEQTSASSGRPTRDFHAPRKDYNHRNPHNRSRAPYKKG
ncbi:MAG: DEAD/DEAH box helicase, partial [Angelakisella sp.]